MFLWKKTKIKKQFTLFLTINTRVSPPTNPKHIICLTFRLLIRIDSSFGLRYLKFINLLCSETVWDTFILLKNAYFGKIIIVLVQRELDIFL